MNSSSNLSCKHIYYQQNCQAIQMLFIKFVLHPNAKHQRSLQLLCIQMLHIQVLSIIFITQTDTQSKCYVPKCHVSQRYLYNCCLVHLFYTYIFLSMPKQIQTSKTYKLEYRTIDPSLFRVNTASTTENSVAWSFQQYLIKHCKW